MTIFFPDVSSYTPNVDVSKYPIVIARATLSSSVADPTYQTFKAKASAAGTLFLAYHWLNHGNLPAQAKWAFQHVGPDVPLMIDAEDKAGNTGYNGPITIDDIVTFTDIYRALGGTVSLCYLPFWYWSGAMGAPRQLDQIAAAGLHLASSNYPTAGYTETGPGWLAYYFGAPAPVQWQYTSTPVDMNAYRGTAAEYAQLVGATVALTDDDVNKVALAAALNAARATLLAGATYIAGYPSGPASELGNWNLRDAVKDIAADVKALAAPADPAAVAAALTPEQLAAIGKAAGEAIVAHLHVS